MREVTLLGQTVNSWHPPDTHALSKPTSRTQPSSSQFPALLRRIAQEVPGLQRLRYTSPHPRHLTPALISAHAELEVLPSHLHLPVQSGSDRVLRRMARRYTSAEYIRRTDALKDAKPGLTMSTDIIVGFPGETEDDFQRTLALVKRVGFVAAFCFKYSPRPYTPALQLGEGVSEDVKDDRLARLFALVEQQQQAHLATLVGTQQQVLVEGVSPGDTGRFTGRTLRNEIVHVLAPAGKDPTGDLVLVTIDQAYRHSLAGHMQEATAAGPGTQRTKLSVVDAGSAA